MTKIVSHDGLSVDAMSIKTWRDHVDGGRPELVCFDEVQFFTDPHFDCDIIDVVRGLLGEGVDVVANGLDMTADGDPFPITATLMALADEVVKVKSNCSICGTAATKTLKIAGSGAQIELGSVGMYEPRCNSHWE
jgi:thymidine kinase